MFKKLNIFKKSIEIELLHTTDLHSHLLPSIDDGVDSLEESIEILLGLKKLGFKKIITTPHTMSHRYPNTKNTISYQYDIVKKELENQNIDLELEYASEYYYDEHFLDLIKKNKLLTFGDNYVLFEFSYHNKPFLLEETIYRLLTAGYKPILAHPERYTFYKSEEDYLKLKDMGIYFQINLNSTQGFYGNRVKKAVEKIINLGIVDFIGSDIHHKKYLDTFSKAIKSEIYMSIMKTNKIKNCYL